MEDSHNANGQIWDGTHKKQINNSVNNHLETSVYVDGSMLESQIIAAQSDDKYIERMRFEGEMLSDVDIARIEFESVQFIQCQFIKCDFSKTSF